MSYSNVNLSIIIAAYNEETIIEKNILNVIEELSQRPSVKWEILCVNDGSKDRTGELLDKLSQDEPRVRIVHHRRNFGQGRALRTAFNLCLGDVIITLDADMSYGPEYIYQLLDALNEKNADIVLASAYMKGGSIRNVPFYRSFLSRFGNYYLGKMSGYPISTSTCVVRAYRREVIDSILLTSDGMEMLIEILNKAILMGYKVIEIPAKLEWEITKKAAETEKKRISKMKIPRTINRYLLLGWLSRPAYIFVLLSLVLIIPGGYMAFLTVVNVFNEINNRIETQGLLWAISNGLKSVFANYTYGMFISVSLLLIGIQVFAFSLILLQNQYYYEELIRLIMINKKNLDQD